MNITVLDQPPFEPVSWAEVFLHLRLGDSDDADDAIDHPDYALLQVQIAAARKHAEQITQRSFVQQTLLLTDNFENRHGYWYPYWSRCGASYIELPRPPLVSIASVSYYDLDNVLQVVDQGDYFVVDDLVPRLQFGSGFAFPCTHRRSDVWRIEYVAGYAPSNSPAATQDDFAANVPAGIKQAILLGVQLQYDDLTPEQAKRIETTRDSLLSAFRIPVLR